MLAGGLPLCCLLALLLGASRGQEALELVSDPCALSGDNCSECLRQPGCAWCAQQVRANNVLAALALEKHSACVTVQPFWCEHKAWNVRCTDRRATLFPLRLVLPIEQGIDAFLEGSLERIHSLHGSAYFSPNGTSATELLKA